MKSYSLSFNKRSRLNRIPEIGQQTAGLLQPLEQGRLTERLSTSLMIENDFYPCFDWTFPPPLLNKSEPPVSTDELFMHASVIPDTFSLYLHSPFCKTLCNFCYYTIIPGRGIENAERYVDYLLREMKMYAEVMQDKKCESVYFGGGTPTFLDDHLLAKLFEGINQHFNLADEAEISIESSPGTLSRGKVELLTSLGINRLSYGIQTLDEKLLASMNRHYSVDEALKELDYALALIGNVNVDTMYGFENESDDALQATLQKFYDLGVPSLSIYALDRQRDNKNKELGLPPKDESYEDKIRIFSDADRFLFQKGYRQILQNVYAIPGKASYHHQLRRWDNLTLVSLGVAAQGYAPRIPYQNYPALKSYYRAIDEGRLPIVTVDHLSAEMELMREVSSQLRFTQVDLDSIQHKYGVDLDVVFADLIDSLIELGYLQRELNTLRMTLSASYYNNIIPMLFAPDAFSQELLGLPEEYLEAFPVPSVMVQVGCTQSAPIEVRLRE
ncbi:Coproporphyrinogen III oxidase, oxygen-independent [hydrothermal vent metagenome]|uniref:Coproporphyrinogen III oxidase, oxygen-independent n=1 Tax=hydrothermal vent metagenome TaxID=652676 RepID=A0A3B1BRK6_9ZZZZ